MTADLTPAAEALLDHYAPFAKVGDPEVRVKSHLARRAGLAKAVAAIQAEARATAEREIGSGRVDDYAKGYNEGWTKARATAEAEIDVLALAFAIDEHALAYPASEPIHDDGTCSTDCAGDIAHRYGAEMKRRLLAAPPTEEDNGSIHQ